MPAEDAGELLDLLEHGSLTPGAAMTALDRFDDDAKREAVTRVARRFDPPPNGQLLAALLSIRTDDNTDEIVATYLTNLRSPDPDGRRASLYGLDQLGYPKVQDLALASLRDEADRVVVTAVQVLLPAGSAGDDRLQAILRGVLAAHRGDPDFYMTTTLLEAQGFGG